MTDTYRIKALEWVNECDSWQLAKTPFGTFCVFGSIYNPGAFKARFDHYGIMEWIGHNFDSLDAAKAACEQHWHDTIKQALEEV